jgi:PTH1 family peptidyl-tRNA hydrolase
MFKNLRGAFFQDAAFKGPVEFIVAGLGNPGAQYAQTRHNAGFMALDYIASARGVRVERIRFKALVGEGELEGRPALLMKPSTYMNLSGEAVQAALHYYRLPPSRLIVLYDDVSLAPGRLRIRLRGSDGGHNGVRNIIELLNSDEFPRIKLGVGGKPHPDYDMKDWVLSRFSPQEKKLVDEAVHKASQAVLMIVEGKAGEAMNCFNG